MVQYNMLEAKTNFSKLIKLLEDKKEDVVIIARNGKPIADITIHKSFGKERVGCAVGVFPPIDFDALEKDNSIIELFDSEKDLF